MKCKQGPGVEQKSQWNEIFAQHTAFFGEESSDFAKRSLQVFQQEGVRSVLELGCGQGRDTLLFAQNDFEVTSLDYSEKAIDTIKKLVQDTEFYHSVHAQTHDVKESLPFSDNSFDACFAHMLLCMELSTVEIESLLREMHRVLKPEGLAVYSVRSNFDPHYQVGEHLGEDLYRIGGLVVHFFTAGKIRQLACGYTILDIDRIEEGSLPRDLFAVTLRKAVRPQKWDLKPTKENEEMNDPLEKFQEFFDASLAPGALDRKTKHLVALGAALAVGCDS